MGFNSGFKGLKQSKFSPHSAFVCFARISEQTAITSLYSINPSVFITQTEGVYYAVRTESLNNVALTRRTNRRSLGTFQK